MENNSPWTDAKINCLLALREGGILPIIVTDTDTNYIVTTATHADRLVMSGQIHSDH